MYYFLASYNGDTTTISIITKEKVIDEKETYINVDNYVESLAKAIIELSHRNSLFHNDINGIGLLISNIGEIYYKDINRLKNDLESTFGFKAIIESKYDTLILNLTA